MTDDLLTSSAPPGDLQTAPAGSPLRAIHAGPEASRNALIRVRALPSWIVVVAIWVASRVITTAFLLVFAASEGRTFWAGPKPNYLQVAEFWDSGWYQQIATQGYPSVLPVSASGTVLDNAWAFYPAYPELVRALITVTGVPWEVLAVIVSLGFSLAGALLFHKLMRLSLPTGASLFAVVLLCIAPLSAIQQVAYAESMGAFLLTLALYLVVRRKYLWLLPVIAVMDLTRPIGAAFALFLIAHLIYRLLRQPFAGRSRYAAISSTVFAIAMVGAWPLIAWVSTGSPGAYLASELAWRTHSGVGTSGIPFEAWLSTLVAWQSPVVDTLVTAGLAGVAVLLVFSRSVRRLAVELRLWLGAYALYLAAVFLPQSSTFRLFVPMSPLLGAAAVPRSRLWRVGLVIASLVLQGLWIWFGWFNHGGGTWSPP